MPRVHLLDKETAELIAAGEVIERPSSVIKELVENSIDSGARIITVEIKRGGISYIRITDNGCGISFSDVPTAFLRHATSKIGQKDDLLNIMTLGFRGEALASVCAVARCELLTKPAADEYGTHYVIEGSQEKAYERSGCPDGTTIIVRDIFYNVPARLKFLKKDVTEGNAIASIISRIAVSHPEISFRFIRDNRQELFTPGDSRLYSAVYSVFGKEFAASLIPVSYRLGGIGVSGYTVKPLWGRKNRTMQHFFVNGRYVKSLTCMSSLEEAYKNTIMEGKFPACVLFLDIPPSTVDVNVHPAKTEVRFSDDRAIYDALYFAVKNALLADEKPAELKIPERKRTAADYAQPMFSDPPSAVQTSFDGAAAVTPAEVINKDNYLRRESINALKSEDVYSHSVRVEDIPKSAPKDIRNIPPKAQNAEHIPNVSEHLQESYRASENGADTGDIPLDALKGAEQKEFKYISEGSLVHRSGSTDPKTDNEPPQEKQVLFRMIGEAFKNYVIAETEDGLLIVDKHAAHERIRFERLRTGREELSAQMLISPERLMLDFEEYGALVKNLGVCADCGFEIEPQKAPYVLVKGIPSILDRGDAADIVTELAQNFVRRRHDPLPELLDDIYHSMACKGAIKANDVNTEQELSELVRQVLSDERIRYCPHGRPVMFCLTKRELEKQFKRIV